MNFVGLIVGLLFCAAAAGGQKRWCCLSSAAAHVWAEQQRSFDQAGVRMPLADSYIAATARRHRLTIVTGNDRDYRRPGLAVLNPFREST